MASPACLRGLLAVDQEVFLRGGSSPVIQVCVCVQVRAEDGVHPGEAPSRPASAGHREFLSHDQVQNRKTCLRELAWIARVRPYLSDVTNIPACSLCQIFWMIGSMLIIVLGMLVVPTLGWRWMIRISVTPSVVLIFLFKVRPLILWPRPPGLHLLRPPLPT